MKARETSNKGRHLTTLNAATSDPPVTPRKEITQMVKDVNNYIRNHPDPCNPFRRRHK